MDEANRKIKEMTIVAVGVATIIGGGLAIFVVSSIFPIPGVKYVFMSPYLSTVIYVIQSKMRSNIILFKLGIVFAMIMAMINLFMGISIILTTLLTHLSISVIKDDDQKAFWGSVLFSGYSGICALAITGLFSVGIVDKMPNWWLLVIGLISIGFGIVATNLSRILLKHMRVHPLINEEKKI